MPYPHQSNASLLLYLTKTAAYELALVRPPSGPPVVHLRLSGRRRSIVFTVAELEAFYADVARLWDYLQQGTMRRVGRPLPRS